MLFASGIATALLLRVATVSAGPVLENRAIVSNLTTAEIASYTPFTYYAATGYCSPATTLAWNCGVNCANNPTFKPIASGGDGALVQYWFVGYDPTLKTIIVTYQGTLAAKILPLVTDLDLALDNLKPSLFPGVSSSIKTHNGFGEAHARSAKAVLAAVKKGLSTYGTNTITVVGHSLGGALAIISSGHLALQIPTATIKTVSFSPPRVGNVQFANWVNSKAEMVRINNKKDYIPIVPGRFLGFAHTEGEIHITSDNQWISCPGQDNDNYQCTVGTVANIFVGDFGDHSGPFNGIMATCD